MKPQILILGSTGRTGKWLLEEAPKPSLTIHRRSVAKFMLDCLENQLYIHQKPIISA
jgi:hypothetical protein